MLDTYASQAVGAGNYSTLGSLWRQCVGWVLLHTIPAAAAFACVPAALAWLGQSAELRALLRPYLLALLPAVWTDAVYRCAVWCGHFREQGALLPPGRAGACLC